VLRRFFAGDLISTNEQDTGQYTCKIDDKKTIVQLMLTF